MLHFKYLSCWHFLTANLLITLCLLPPGCGLQCQGPRSPLHWEPLTSGRRPAYLGFPLLFRGSPGYSRLTVRVERLGLPSTLCRGHTEQAVPGLGSLHLLSVVTSRRCCGQAWRCHHGRTTAWAALHRLFLLTPYGIRTETPVDSGGLCWVQNGEKMANTQHDPLMHVQQHGKAPFQRPLYSWAVHDPCLLPHITPTHEGPTH